MTHVLIPDYPVRVQFSVGGTASAGPFAFNFTFFALADIHVQVAGVELVQGTQFTVTGNPGTEGGYQGGSVTLVTAVANATVTVMRVLPLERVSDFPDAGSFNRRTLNTTLDKHVAMIQQVDERVDRALTTPPGGPPITLVANSYLKVDSLASGIVPVPPLQVRTDIQAQPLDPTLTALAALVTGANQIIVATGVDSFAMAPVTAAGLNLLDDADAAAQRTTLGLGTMATQNANAVAITGGTISGVAVAVPGLGTMSVQNANAVTITGGSITGMPSPLNLTDVVTKQYADGLAFGISKRTSVRVASTTNYTRSTLAIGSVIDGVTLNSADRFLLKDQTNPNENGVYFATIAGPPPRATDFDTYEECPGSLCTVQEGTANHDRVYMCTSDLPGAIEASPIIWARVDPGIAVPVIISQGGTGQVTAAAGFDALKQPATSAYVGAVQLATQAEVNTGTDAVKAVTPATLAGKPVASQVEVNAGVEATKAVTSATLAGKLPTVVGTFAQCRLDTVSGSVLRLSRYNGYLLTIDNVPQVIPAAGVDLVPSGVSVGVVYYIYAYMVGSVMTLIASGGAPVIDPRNGMKVLTGNAALTLVGMARIDTGPAWHAPSQTFIVGALSHFNRKILVAEGPGLGGTQTNSVSLVPASAQAAYALNWADDKVVATFTGVGAGNQPAIMTAQFLVDGAGPFVASQDYSSVGGAPGALSQFGWLTMSEAVFHTYAIGLATQLGVMTWNGAVRVSVMG